MEKFQPTTSNVEQTAPAVEDTIERIPTAEHITTVFELVTGDRKYEELRRIEDDKGVYVWNIKLIDPDAEGDTYEYSYLRRGTYPPPDGSPIETAVYITCYRDGLPITGDLVANYVDGTWAGRPYLIRF